MATLIVGIIKSAISARKKWRLKRHFSLTQRLKLCGRQGIIAKTTSHRSLPIRTNYMNIDLTIKLNNNKIVLQIRQLTLRLKLPNKKVTLVLTEI